MNLDFLRSTTDSRYLRKLFKKCSASSENFDYLLSFPRSGNGWLRLVICLMVLESRGIDTTGAKIGTIDYDGVKGHCISTANFKIGVDEIFPDVYIASRTERLQLRPDEKRPLLKTHHVPPADKCRLIYLYRDPIESLPSYLNLAEPNWRDVWNERETAHAMRVIAECYNSLSMWVVENVSNREGLDCIFLNLGDLKTYGEIELAWLLEWIEVPFERSTLTRVLSEFPLRSGFDKRLMALHSSILRSAVRVATKGYLSVVELHRGRW